MLNPIALVERELAPMSIATSSAVNSVHMAQQDHSVDLAQLHAIIEGLRAENARLVDREEKIVELLGAQNPERIIHDLRNLLNERELLKALARLDD